jgi:hypothetical protein
MSTRLPSSGSVLERAPGLYFDWRAGGVAAPSVMPSGVPLFVGLTGRGHASEGPAPVRRLLRWQQFDDTFAGDGVSERLACAVRGFFENGGDRCYVMPIDLDADASADIAADVDMDTHGRAIADAIRELFADGGILDSIDVADLVCVPDVMAPAIARSVELVTELQSCVVEYCARMGDRFAILDVRAGDPANVGSDRSGGVLIDTVGQWQMLPASHGALYFPWVRVARHRPGGNAADATVLVPPCGHVAGVYARSDRRLGPHKPPANELLEGVLDLAVKVGDSEQAMLNGVGVNCLRVSSGWGIRVWGARTLSDRPAWMYVNVTRVMLALKRWLERDLHDLVFELNSPLLWGFVSARIERYCRDLYRKGALKGRNPSEAYFVKCDAETNSSYDGDSGTVVAQVGLAPAAPGEFVIVRITQSASGVTVTGAAATQ